MGDQAVLLFKPAGRVMDIPPILSTAELTATTSKIQGPVNGRGHAAHGALATLQKLDQFAIAKALGLPTHRAK